MLPQLQGYLGSFKIFENWKATELVPGTGQMHTPPKTGLLFVRA